MFLAEAIIFSKHSELIMTLDVFSRLSDISCQPPRGGSRFKARVCVLVDQRKKKTEICILGLCNFVHVERDFSVVKLGTYIYIYKRTSFTLNTVIV